MTAADEFASLLLDEAKRFLEKAASPSEESARTAYNHAALLTGFAAFEAHLNSMADDFLVRPDLNALDRSILAERDVQLIDGEHVATDRLRIYRLEDRIEFMHRRFGSKPLDKSAPVWSEFQTGLKLRNKLTHPRDAAIIDSVATKHAIEAIVDLLSILYSAVYKRPFPAAARRLDSRLTF